MGNLCPASPHYHRLCDRRGLDPLNLGSDCRGRSHRSTARRALSQNSGGLPNRFPGGSQRASRRVAGRGARVQHLVGRQREVRIMVVVYANTYCSASAERRPVADVAGVLLECSGRIPQPFGASYRLPHHRCCGDARARTGTEPKKVFDNVRGAHLLQRALGFRIKALCGFCIKL